MQPIFSYAFDFAANYCAAEWTTAVGDLSCPGGIPNDKTGYVQLLEKPHLENRIEDELTLVTHLNSAEEGWIMGIFPPYRIQSSD